MCEKCKKEHNAKMAFTLLKAADEKDSVIAGGFVMNHEHRKIALMIVPPPGYTLDEVLRYLSETIEIHRSKDLPEESLKIPFGWGGMTGQA